MQLANEPEDNENFLPLVVSVWRLRIDGGKSSDIVENRLSMSETLYPLVPNKLK